jgi:hypothetical protein
MGHMPQKQARYEGDKQAYSALHSQRTVVVALSYHVVPALLSPQQNNIAPLSFFQGTGYLPAAS